MAQQTDRGRMSASKDKNTTEACTFAYFLESVPPGSKRAVFDLFSGLSDKWHLNAPDIRLHCPTEKCGGVRIFKNAVGRVELGSYGREDFFLTYLCRNCNMHFKTYALEVNWHNLKPGESGSAVKYGEMPAFGPPLPARLLKMVADDRDLFLKGRRTESQSLGIGAFAYYRLVVENQKDRLLEEIRKAAVRLGADEEQLRSIDLAKKEMRFSKAIDLVKDAIPDGLKVKGHNPLTLLHNTLSKGVHGHSDEECLAQAQAVRIVLTELVSKIAQVTKDESELDAAVSKLLSVE